MSDQMVGPEECDAPDLPIGPERMTVDLGPYYIRFLYADALDHGMEGAILLSHFRKASLLRYTRGEGCHDGQIWHPQSVSSLALAYPFIAEKQISRALGSLVEKEALFLGNYGQTKMNRTHWYAVPGMLLDMETYK